MRTSVVVFLALALSCGGSSSPATNGTDTGPSATTAAIGGAKGELPAETAAVAPLEVHKKPRNVAVILGTDPSGGSTSIPLITDKTEVEVDVMWVKKGKPMTGGTSKTSLSAIPQQGEKVRIGVFEQFEGGMGAQSRSAIWLASFLATTTLGRDLTDFELSAEVGGFVDGPSAGGLFTAGYLAALTGAEIDPSATMTGTVNPDGTIGPVGGIPQKFAGSIKQGKKRLGYPVGSRNAIDANTGRAVDLHALAAQGGAEAVEIRDIYDAYELMTGVKLPRPVPLPPSEMDLEPEVAAAFSKRFAVWKNLRSTHWSTLVAKAKSGAVPIELKKIALTGARETGSAEQAYKEGLYATAYFRGVEATVYAVSATELYRIYEAVSTGDVNTALQIFAAKVKTLENTVQTMERIGKMHPDTIGGHLLMISAFQKGTEAVGFAVWGLESARAAEQYLRSLQKLPAEELAKPAVGETVVKTLSPVVLNFTRGEAAAIAASQALEIESTQTIHYSCSEPAARKLARSYESAALANLRYFESITLQQISQVTGMSRARARAFLGKIEPDFVAATTAMQMSLGQVPFVKKLKDQWGEESLAWSLQSLAGSVLSYFRSSLLISTWYSLNVKKDRQTGKATAVGRGKAFINMLESAERTAREHAHAAKVAVGHVPVQARIAYQRARVLREGDIDDKLRALEEFWASSSYSQTAVVMARQVINPAKHGKFGQ